MNVLHCSKIPNTLEIYKPNIISKDTYTSKVLYLNKDIFIQTPKLLVYFTPKKYNYYYQICLCCYNYTDNDILKEFISKIKRLDTYAKKSLPQLKPYLSRYRYKFISSIVKCKHKDNYYFKLKIPIVNNTIKSTIYDEDKNIQSINFIESKTECISIISLHSLWYSKNKFGYKWILTQIKMYPLYKQFNECFIDNDTIDIFDNLNHKTDDNKEYHPIYGKFIKMKRLGIPLNAIYNKIILENLNIDKFKLLIDEKVSINKKSVLSKKSTIPVLTPNMLLSKSLKKTHNNPNNKSDKLKKSTLFAPTENELARIIMNLKNIKKI